MTITILPTGAQNTIDILVEGSSVSAAYVCDMLVLNGYYDWFLPSTGELDAMYANITILDAVFVSNGGDALATDRYYWSSTQEATSSAWHYDFSNGSSSTSTKILSYRVRAVRAF